MNTNKQTWHLPHTRSIRNQCVYPPTASGLPYIVAAHISIIVRIHGFSPVAWKIQKGEILLQHSSFGNILKQQTHCTFKDLNMFIHSFVDAYEWWLGVLSIGPSIFENVCM